MGWVHITLGRPRRAADAPPSCVRHAAFGMGAAAWLAVAVGLALTSVWAPLARATEFQVRGLLDVTAAQRNAAYDLNLLTRNDSPFDAYGVRLFGDARVNDHLQVFTQLMWRDESGIYVDGAYATWTPWLARDLHVEAGKIPWPIGTYAPRTYSNRNPLIGAPLMYQYHSTLLWYDLPPNADALLATAGQGQYGSNYHGFSEGRGMPIVDDSYWDVGAVLLGSAAPWEFAAGGVSGTPGWASTGRDDNSGKTVLGRVGVTPVTGLRFGVSGAYGPYLAQSAVRAKLPPGHETNEYHQRLGMADLEVLAGHVELRAEGARNRWDSPFIGGLNVTSGYAELKVTSSCGGYVAGRYDVMRFGKITDSTGARRRWDADVTRIEAGLGYRVSRDVLAKLVYQHDTLDLDGTAGTPYRRPQFVAAQVVVGF